MESTEKLYLFRLYQYYLCIFDRGGGIKILDGGTESYLNCRRERETR